MRDAYCGLSKSKIQNLSSTSIGDPKSEISKDEAIKLLTNANENYLQAAKCIAARNTQEAEQKLKEAASQYETILANGFKHGQIYYNLGNTYYRTGELGKAVLNYRKAQRLMPRNTDLDANLKLVKNSIEDKELPNEIPVVLRRIFFWFFLLSGNELIVAARVPLRSVHDVGFLLNYSQIRMAQEIDDRFFCWFIYCGSIAWD